MNKILLILFGFAVGCGGGAWFAFAQDEPAAVAAMTQQTVSKP